MTIITPQFYWCFGYQCTVMSHTLFQVTNKSVPPPLHRFCNEGMPCPQPIFWSPWGSWTKCSTDCGGGVHSRVRTCENGNSCPGCALVGNINKYTPRTNQNVLTETSCCFWGWNYSTDVFMCHFLLTDSTETVCPHLSSYSYITREGLPYINNHMALPHWKLKNRLWFLLSVLSLRSTRPATWKRVQR